MSITISSGKAFTVYFEMDDTILRAMRKAPAAAERAMAAGADWWHSKILPEHFKKDAHGHYGYAERTKAYMKQARKGTKPDMVYSGAMRRQLIGRYAFKYARGSGGQLTMSARALNFVPKMSNDDPSLYVKHSNTTKNGYPNMKREIKVITEDEHEAIGRIVQAELEGSFPTADRPQ